METHAISVIDIEEDIDKTELDISQLPAELRQIWPTDDMKTNDEIGSAYSECKTFHAITFMMAMGCRPIFTYEDPSKFKEGDKYISAIFANLNKRSSIHDLRLALWNPIMGYNYELLIESIMGDRCNEDAFSRSETTLASGSLVYIIGFRVSRDYIADWLKPEYAKTLAAINSTVTRTHAWNGIPLNSAFVPLNSAAYGAENIGTLGDCVVHINHVIEVYKSVRFFIDLMHSEYNIAMRAGEMRIEEGKSITNNTSAKKSSERSEDNTKNFTAIYPDEYIAGVFAYLSLPKIGTPYNNVIYSTLNNYLLLFTMVDHDIDYTKSQLTKPNTIRIPIRYNRNGPTASLRDLIKVFVDLYGVKNLRAKKLDSVPSIEAFIAAVGQEEYVKLLHELINRSTANSNKVACEHKLPLAAFNYATNSDTMREALEGIKPFMLNPDVNTDMVKCNVCKQDLFCGHNLLRYRYMTGDIETYEELIEQYAPFVLPPSDTLDNTNEIDQNDDLDDSGDIAVVVRDAICAICGAVLYNSDMEDNKDVNMNMSIHVDNSLVWKIGAHLFYNYTTFENEIYDKNSIIRNMVNTCMPILDERIGRVIDKTYIDSYVTMEANLIYAAYLINLDAKTKGAIKFNSRDYFDNIPIREKKKNMRLLETYRARLAYIDAPQTTERFKYAELQNESIIKIITQYIGMPFSEKFIETHLNYFLETKTTRKKKQVKRDIHDVEDNLLGKIKPITLPLLKAITERGVDVLLEYRVKMQYYLSILSYNCMVRFHKLLIDAAIAGNNNNGRVNLDIYDTIYTPPVIKQNIAEISGFLNSMVEFLNCRPKYSLPACDYSMRPSSDTIALHKLYNAAGERHVWDSVIYGNGTPIMLKDAKHPGDKFVTDMYSSSTKTKLSELSASADSSTIKQAFVQSRAIEGLIVFYETRCPVAVQHMIEDGVCANCEYKFADASKDWRKVFYDKYKKKYEMDTKVSNTTSLYIVSKMTSAITSNASTDKTSAYVKQVKAIKAEAGKLNAVIEEVISKFNISDRVFVEHLGAIDGLKYEQLIDGTVAPVYDANTSNNKVYTMKSYLLTYKEMLLRRKLLLSSNISTFNRIFGDVLDSVTTIDIMEWMRFILYEDLLNLFASDEELARTTIAEIFISDLSNCITTEIETLNAMEDADIDQYDPIPDVNDDAADDLSEMIGDGGGITWKEG